MPFRVYKNDQSLVRVSLNDAQADFLYGKISVGAGLTASIANPGANETVHIVLNATPGQVLVSSGDTTAGYLETKIVAGSNITVTKLNTGGNEQLEIAGSGAATKIFPITNAVYVDQDVSSLPAGQLGYNTLNEALVSWQAGGDARVLFGAPTAANPGLILVGVGTFDHNGQSLAGLQYVHVIGISKDVSIIDATSNNTTKFTSPPSHMRWENLWFKYRTNGSENYFADNCNALTDFEFKDCKFTGGNTNGILTAIGGTITAKFIRCDFSGLTGGMTIAQGYASGVGDIDFIECTSTNSSANALINVDGGWTGRMERCYILGGSFSTIASGTIIDSTFSGIVSAVDLTVEGSNIQGQVGTVDNLSVFSNTIFSTSVVDAPCVAEVSANGANFYSCIFVPNGTGASIVSSAPHSVNGQNCLMKNDVTSNVTFNGSRTVDSTLALP